MKLVSERVRAYRSSRLSRAGEPQEPEDWPRMAWQEGE